MPLSSLVNGKIFCTHGGLSPELTSFDQIRQIKRPVDVPDSGLITDLLWADPDTYVKGWKDNDKAVSSTFGLDIVEKFCLKFGVEMIIRAHQVV